MASEFTFVAFDIETTGFDVNDEVTVIGFELALGCRLFLQTGGRPPAASDPAADTEGVDPVASIETAVRERIDEHVVLSVHDDEPALLDAVREFVADRLRDDEVLLVGYNAETWKSGFDLPFLRSRYATCDVAWPFTDLPYADLMPVLTQRFNTTVDGDCQSDLEGVYAAVCEGDLNALDPFAESAAAVTAFEDGRFTPLVIHNVADILRTGHLGAVSRRYCSKSDYQLKSLTPTVDAD